MRLKESHPMKRKILGAITTLAALLTLGAAEQARAQGAPARSAVVITRDPLVSGSIHQTQYGQFIEYLCDLVPSMWAEKLYDGGFEGLSPYKFVFLKETDFKEKPWHPSGEVNRANYTLDKETKVGGEVSKKIEVPSGAPCVAGISQDGIFIGRGRRCDFRIWLRAKDLAGPTRVTLRHEAKVYASCEFNPDGEWQKYHASLVSTETDANATLSIEFRGPGTLWLDNASLIPAETADGWRPDVLEAVRALRPGVIRFGGSTLDDPNLGEFEWKDTVGDPDRRKPFRAWGGLQPTGPGLEEIVRFCRAAGAEPLICVRFSQRAPADAAEEVAYFNGPTNTPMGAWRARNGHPEPYRIKYWQVGNERSGRDYEQKMAAFCAAMKEADPEIKLFSSYPTPAVIRGAGSMLAFVCPHHYTQDLGGAEHNLLEVARMIRENAPGRDIKIAVTEWNTTGGDAGPRRAMLWTLANALACSRYQNLLHRHCDLVEIANRSNLANSFCSGIIQMDNHRLYKTPTYYAQQLYATLGGTKPLRISSALPPNIGLDLSATLSAAGDEVVLFAVNDSSAPAPRRLDFSAFANAGATLTVWTLRDQNNAGEPDATNSFAEPERVAPVRSKFKAGSPRFEYTFPALSLTVLRWKL
jgi:alpha-N-arabinofuranosidase